jgi:hypothetical protein
MQYGIESSIANKTIKNQIFIYYHYIYAQINDGLCKEISNM